MWNPALIDIFTVYYLIACLKLISIVGIVGIVGRVDKNIKSWTHAVGIFAPWWLRLLEFSRVLVIQVVENFGDPFLLELNLGVDFLALQVLVHQQVLDFIAQQLQFGQGLNKTA